MNNFKKEIAEIREESKEEVLKKNRLILGRYFFLFVFVFLIISSFIFGYEKGKNKNANFESDVSVNEAILQNKEVSKNKKIDFSLFWKAWDLVEDNHIDREKLKAQDLVYGAISGMLRATGDPYSDFFDPEESKEFSEDIRGSFEGIGAELGMKDGILTIIAPLDGSPAQSAGLLAGDKILKIEDKMSSDFSIDEAVDLIRGKKGTQVKLTILHVGSEEPEEIVVTRDEIEIKSVKTEFKEGKVAYIKIVKFSENVGMEFDKAVDLVVENQSKGVIIDVRNNPGGLLDESIKVASRMIPKNKVVVLEEDSSGKRKNIYTFGGDKLSSIPMVVLINGGSASASEILAGALRDNLGVSLIGEKSFGKGSVQQLFDLPGGSNVKITVAKWLTPKGEYIMDKGIEPEIKVELSLDDYKNDRDPQLEKAMEVLKEKMK